MHGYEKSQDISWTFLEDKLVILSTHSQKCFHEFNSLATDLWLWLDTVETKDELLQKILAKYDVAEDTASEDLESFLSDLKAKELLVGHD